MYSPNASLSVQSTTAVGVSHPSSALLRVSLASGGWSILGSVIPWQSQLKTRSDPKIEKPTDVIVRITATNICGSDLQMYEGRTNVEKGKILGHENLGEVDVVFHFFLPLLA